MAGAWSHRNREGQRRKPLFCSGSLPADGRHDQRNHRHLEYRQARRTRAPPSSSLPRVRPDGNENDDRKGHRGERRHDEGVEHVSAGTDVKHYAPRLRASAPSRRVRRAASSGTGAGAAGTVRSSRWRWLIPFPGTPIAGYSRRVRNGRFKIVGLDLKGGALARMQSSRSSAAVRVARSLCRSGSTRRRSSTRAATFARTSSRRARRPLSTCSSLLRVSLILRQSSFAC